MKTVGIFLFSFLSFGSVCSFAQGCSDAGFCTMGAMRPDQSFSRRKDIKLRSIEVGSNVGVTKFHDVILSNYLDANVGLSPKSTVQFKLPYTFVFGSLANTSGIGDISLSYTYQMMATESYSLSISAGGKIPTNIANMTKDTLPLPMYYQTSLGTFDFVTGVSFATKKWLFAAGYQMPVYSIVDNEFRWSPYKKTSDSAVAFSYPRSWNLKRGNDIMLRAERNFRFSRINFYTGLLTIYRLNEDVIDFSQEPTLDRHSVPNSAGLVVNGLVGGGYQFSVRSGIKLLFACKLKDRELNPDGLSRVYVTNLSYVFKF